MARQPVHSTIILSWNRFAQPLDLDRGDERGALVKGFQRDGGELVRAEEEDALALAHDGAHGSENDCHTSHFTLHTNEQKP